MTSASSVERGRDRPRPAVSVVVTTRNTARTLAACLQSVVAQDVTQVPGGIELIVVDNASDDDTLAIAERYADVVAQAGPERSAQRNLGMELARGEWYLWVDADMVLAPTVVAAALEAAQTGDAVAVSIPERTVGRGFWTACRTLERSCYVDDPWLFNPRLIRRDLLLALGGFDEQMAGPEDTDLRLRLHAQGVRLAHTPVLIDHDEGRLTLAGVLRKRVYYGRSLPAFAGANPGATRAQGRATLRAYARHRRRLLRDPVHAGGMLLMRAAEAGAYTVGAWQGEQARRRSSS